MRRDRLGVYPAGVATLPVPASATVGVAGKDDLASAASAEVAVSLATSPTNLGRPWAPGLAGSIDPREAPAPGPAVDAAISFTNASSNRSSAFSPFSFTTAE